MLKKAVITAAGLGTRLYPATKIIKKELFPIVDRDGLVKPIIQIIIDELVQSGIAEVCLIVQPEDKPVFQHYFNQPLSAKQISQLGNKPQIIRATETVLDLGKRISYALQDIQDGFGHAVYCAKDWVGNEPFLLLLGDHVYISHTELSCTQQLINVFHKYQKSVSGVVRTPESILYRFGTIGGKPIKDDNRVYEITEFKEKPNIEYAREHLQISGLAKDEYLCVFGQYILTPGIFDCLSYHIEHNLRERNEIQLTSSLEMLRQQESYYAYETQGDRYDIGVPEGYIETITAFANKNKR
ncbi:MAG: UTP--glucose-1-phosphate uridylyltransferase [bacterium]